MKKKYKIIWLDMDGVLCDYIGGAIKHYPHLNLTHDNFATHEVRDVFGITYEEETEFINSKGVEHWATLPLLQGALELVEACKEAAEFVGICTNPGRYQHAKEGKIQWLKDHGVIASDTSVVFAKHKYLVAREDALLIDDYDKNITEFIEHGGKAICVKQPWNKHYKGMKYTHKEIIDILRK